MREIKFRAWDKELKRMSKPFRLGDQLIEWDDGIDVEMLLVFFTSKERGDIMACTELLDINRKEIYQGDIVRRHKYCRDADEYNTGQIVQYEPWHGFVYKQIKDARTHPAEGDLTVDQCIPLSNSRVTSFEIIGNIYENRELLS